MVVLTWLTLAAWSGVAGVWAVLWLAQRRVRRDGLVLSAEVNAGREDAAEIEHAGSDSVCVVVPARNEADKLEACVRSILRQDHARLSVRLIDDRSDDGTLVVAQRLADPARGGDARVSVRHVEDLPPGWLGKSHAMWCGTRGVESDWLLFLDADCRLSPAAVRAALREAHLRDADALTLWPAHAGETFWEHMLIPLCGGVIALWFGGAGRSGSDRPAAFANGQFLLIRRAAYERVDGHRAVRDALIEDVPFAEHAQRSGLRVCAAAGGALVQVRMYEDLRSILDGWARIFVGALRSGAKLLASVAWLLIGNLLPFAALPVLLTLTVLAGGGTALPLVATLVVCTVHLLLIVVVSHRFWGLGRCDRRYLWLYPFSVIVVTGVLLRGWWWLIVRRSVAWRNTRYRIDRRGAIVC